MTTVVLVGVVVLVVIALVRGTELVVDEVVDVVGNVVDVVGTVIGTVVGMMVGSGAGAELNVSIGSLEAGEPEQEEQAAITANTTIDATDLRRRSSRMVNRFTPT